MYDSVKFLVYPAFSRAHSFLQETKTGNESAADNPESVLQAGCEHRSVCHDKCQPIIMTAMRKYARASAWQLFY